MVVITKKEKIIRPFVKLSVRTIFAIGRVAIRIPKLRNKIHSQMKDLTYTENSEDFADGMFTESMRKLVEYQTMVDVMKTVKVGSLIPETFFYQLQVNGTHTETTMSLIQRADVPLVLNFGSCS